MHEPPPWHQDERVPCVCPAERDDGMAQMLIARAELWVTEHYLAGACPRHRPLGRWRERIATSLADLDARPRPRPCIAARQR